MPFALAVPMASSLPIIERSHRDLSTDYSMLVRTSGRITKRKRAFQCRSYAEVICENGAEIKLW